MRAHHIGLTCDEASTYLSHTNRNLWGCFFSDSCWSDANNHWLNTFLMQKSITVFGVSELSLRLPNLLGHLLYLIASIFLIKNISKNIWVALGGFCLLNFNPFLLEFFALARGYGLGVGCMMMSLTLFFLWIKNQKSSFLLSSFFTAVLAVLSNFIFLNYIACLVAVFTFEFISKFYKNIFTLERNQKSLKNISYPQLSIPILTSIFLFLILKTPIQTLRNKGEFVYGSDSLSQSFYELVLDSVMAQGYLHPYTSDTFFYVSLLFLMIASLIGIISFIKNQKYQIDFFSKIYFAGVLFLIILLSALTVQYYFLDIKYLIDRKSVILIPIISLPVYFLLEKIYQKPSSPLKGELPSNLNDTETGRQSRSMTKSSDSLFRELEGLILPILFSIFFINHFERTSNLTKSVEWIYDAHTKEMMQYFQNHSSDKTISLGVFWIFGPTSEFYQQQFSLEKKVNLKRLEQNELPTTQDYDHIYILKNQEGILPKKYIIEKRFGESGILYRLTKTQQLN